MTLERSVASKSDSVDLSDSCPDFLTADWYTDWDMSQYFNLDFVPSQDPSLFQVLELPLPSPSSTATFNSIFSPETLLDTSSFQPVRQNGVPSLLDVPGPSSFQSRTTTIPLDKDVRNHDDCYKGVTRGRVRVTGGAHAPTVVPITSLSVPSLPSAATFPLNWIKVPQRNYDHGRKQWSFKKLEPVSFGVGGRPGINLGNALRKRFEGLDGRDDPVLQDAAGAISCRFLFPGYPDTGGSFQIHALDWTRKRQPITRSKLAHEVSKKLERYLRQMAKIIPDKSVESQWAIGQGFMHIDNMFLVRLVSVSRGSFQPEIWVVDPSAPHALVA